jgi:antirestriction protein ArdC
MKKKKSKERIDPYQLLTDKIISKLESGEIPWKKPWKSVQFGYPKNMISDKTYKGANFFNALFEDRESPHWLTFKQAKDLGGSIRKGESGLPIVYFQFLEKVDDNGNDYVIPLVKKSTVFNIEQCDGIENPTQAQKEKFEAENLTEFNPLEHCEKLLESFKDKIAPYENTSHPKAYYRPSSDTINMPMKERFITSEGYYATLFHEIGHSTGHSSRLDRPGITEHAPHGSKKYAKEELVAELTSAFLCSKAGIENDVVDNNAAYIKSWLGALRNDKMLVYDAMKDAFKAIQYLGIVESEA